MVQPARDDDETIRFPDQTWGFLAPRNNLAREVLDPGTAQVSFREKRLPSRVSPALFNTRDAIPRVGPSLVGYSRATLMITLKLIREILRLYGLHQGELVPLVFNLAHAYERALGIGKIDRRRLTVVAQLISANVRAGYITALDLRNCFVMIEHELCAALTPLEVGQVRLPPRIQVPLDPARHPPQPAAHQPGHPVTPRLPGRQDEGNPVHPVPPGFNPRLAVEIKTFDRGTLNPIDLPPPGLPQSAVTANQYTLLRLVRSRSDELQRQTAAFLISRIARLQAVGFADANDLRQRCVHLLLGCEATLNIKPQMLFTSPLFVKTMKYESPWAHPELWDRGSGASGNPDYRHETELTMARDPHNPVAALLLQPTERPIYGGLNICNSPDGAAGHYGKAFFRLHPRVKLRATYTPNDSWAMLQGTAPVTLPEFLRSRVTLANPDMLLLKVPDHFLRLIIQTALGQNVAGQLRDEDYIEAHFFGPIDVRFDVTELVIDAQDLLTRCDLPKRQEEYQTCKVRILDMTSALGIRLTVRNPCEHDNSDPWSPGPHIQRLRDRYILRI